jgi:hypothetical protein
MECCADSRQVRQKFAVKGTGHWNPVRGAPYAWHAPPVWGTQFLPHYVSRAESFAMSRPAHQRSSVLGSQHSATTYVSGCDVALIGPALEGALVKNFFLEMVGVYHLNQVSRRSVSSNDEVIDWFSGIEGRTFEFPVLGKYKFGAGRVKPLVEAGPSFRLLTDNSSLFGVTAGTGLEMRLRSLKIAPALRFTHWGPQGNHSLSTAIIANQVEFSASLLL